jgi:hypothetical protein
MWNALRPGRVQEAVFGEKALISSTSLLSRSTLLYGDSGDNCALDGFDIGDTLSRMKRAF